MLYWQGIRFQVYGGCVQRHVPHLGRMRVSIQQSDRSPSPYRSRALRPESSVRRSSVPASHPSNPGSVRRSPSSQSQTHLHSSCAVKWSAWTCGPGVHHDVRLVPRPYLDPFWSFGGLFLWLPVIYIRSFPPHCVSCFRFYWSKWATLRCVNLKIWKQLPVITSIVCKFRMIVVFLIKWFDIRWKCR